MKKLFTVLSLSLLITVIAAGFAVANENSTANYTNSCKVNTSAAQPVVTESNNQVTPSQTASAETKDQKFRVGPTVRLRPLNSEINKSSDGLVELFMNNPSLNDVTLEVDVSVDVPSDIYIDAQDGGMSGGAGAVTGHFTVPPGSSRTVTLHIKGEKVGNYPVHFSGMYWPGNCKDKWNPISLDNSFAVNEPAPVPTSTPAPTSSNSIPGIGAAASLILILGMAFLLKRK